MNQSENLRLRDPEIMPTDEVLEHALGESYVAYGVLQQALHGLDIE